MGEPPNLPTVTLVEGAMYWVLSRYGEPANRWTVARWESGCFWGIGGGEVSPAVICGPIPHPTESGADSPSEASAGNPATDETNPTLRERGE